ncbi:MAG TPA: phosphoribosylformylglycinamidine cyclo-ligase [Candidatus Polarisedimenticolia bacterium]|jgi:phosphoribosylformylglycinamidine cyclo-ligase|nr:phosphoribosylformylglycinamidine cyclo-ligase [Candidatus Polarisedimenticolia bacterium]
MPREIRRASEKVRKIPSRTGVSYRDAGVDIDAKMSAIASFSSMARATFSRAVLTEIGSFGGLYDLGHLGMKRPVLVSSIDGVGTKLKVALLCGRHDTVGEDLVNHCVNDVLVQGAVPLFFLDYLSTGKVRKELLERIVSGIAKACKEAGCALIGGETAEMPGFYDEGEYDLAGCIVGAVERSAILDGSKIRPGDRLLGLPSSGLHTNGYSLARKVLFEVMHLKPTTHLAELGRTIGEELLEPHRSYLRVLRPLLGKGLLKGMAHITGGGFTDNIPRILPEGCAVELDPGTWKVPSLFSLIQEGGNVSDTEMRRTFNLGIGMVLVVGKLDADSVKRRLERRGEGAALIGTVVPGNRRVIFSGAKH